MGSLAGRTGPEFVIVPNGERASPPPAGIASCNLRPRAQIDPKSPSALRGRYLSAGILRPRGSRVWVAAAVPAPGEPEPG